MADQFTGTRESWKDVTTEGEVGRVWVITTLRMRDEDGDILRTTTHRRPIEPDADISSEPAIIQRIAEAVRTPEALARWEAVQEASE